MNDNISTPDYFGSPIESKILADRIQSYWHQRGYPKVKAWVETNIDNFTGKRTYNVRSNIVFDVKDAYRAG